MERFYATNDSYAVTKGGDAATLPTRMQAVPAESPRYNLTLTIDATTPNIFTLTATPIQADALCGNLTLTHTGVKGSSIANGLGDAAEKAALIALCWK
jgi:Tfp pilus assembly protein PilE